MRTSARIAIVGTCLALMLVLTGCGDSKNAASPTSPSTTPQAVTAEIAPPVAPPPLAPTIIGSAANCGLLYDKWWVVTGGSEPTTTHSAYPAVGQKSGADTWRCKECHGWDYRGASGAYGSGSHYSGIGGVLAAKGRSTQAIFNQIKSGGNHDFSAVLSDADISLLVEFIQRGTFNMNRVIDFGTKQSLGDPVNGQALWASQCRQCHGANGRGNPADVPGEANGNPWETLHKIRWGHPGSNMPSMVDAGLSLSEQSDILAYAQSLGG